MFNSNGQIQRIARYRKGLLNGAVNYYAQNRKDPVRIEHYKAFPKEDTALLHGAYQTFTNKGILIEDIRFKNGAKNGPYTYYYPSGKQKEKGRFEDNLHTGNLLFYSASEILLRDENFIIIDNPNDVKPLSDSIITKNRGKRLGPRSPKISVRHRQSTYYYRNGDISSIDNFVKGEKNGICKTYYQNPENSLKSEVVFKDGKEHGAFHYKSPDGNTQRKGIYYKEIRVGDSIYHNVYDGKIEVFQQNGQRQRIENWKNFKKNGVQEIFAYKTGTLSERSHFIDNLKSGLEERFDAEGNKTYEVHYEIVEKNAQLVSQKAGVETYWEKGQIKTINHWKDGQRNGISKSFFENGNLAQMMHFENDKLVGAYQTFYENGQLKQDYNKKPWIGTGNSENVGWNTAYSEDGQINRKFYADDKGKILLDQSFEEGKRKFLDIDDLFRLSFSDTHQLNKIQWQRHHQPSFSFDLFGNLKLRKLHFSIKNYPTLMANYTSDGTLIQVMDARGENIVDIKAQELAQQVADQYQPTWSNQALVLDKFPEGNYQWKYADGRLFFDINFKNNLPHGKWLLHNPIKQDTLFYGEFNQGLPVSKSVRKKLDATLELRQVFYPNHQLKESYRYEHDGQIGSIEKNDSLGNRTYSEQYYAGGKLKSKIYYETNSYINFAATGDTLSYQLLDQRRDSIIIRRQFYDHNKLKSDRKNNFTTGDGYVKTYYENGQIQTSHELKDNQSNGIYQKFAETGELLNEGHFKDGKRHGKWINYDKNGKTEISFFENGEISLDHFEESERRNECKCFDTSLPGAQIGFAQSLNYFAEYKSIQAFIPPSIIPIDNWNYEKIFFLNLRTDNQRRGGSTYFKLLFFKDFSFYYPSQNHLKFNLVPCMTTGYLGNIETSVSYDFEQQTITFAQMRTQRISVSLASNPLVDAKDLGEFTAYFDTKNIGFDQNGIQAIDFTQAESNCFPLANIHNFMEIEIGSAQLAYNPQHRFYSAIPPILPNELKQFYGLVIDKAEVSFTLDQYKIKAKADQILAGANFVAGSIYIEGQAKGEDEFVIAQDDTKINLNKLHQILEQNGFYRIKIQAEDNRLNIDFYAEK